MSKGKRLAVEDLIPGLYVEALDRPWLETPFELQGFPIREPADIERLAVHCSTVYIDPAASDPAALERVAGRLEQREPRPPLLPPGDRREQHADVREAFGDAVYPNGRRFRELLRVAREARRSSREFVETAFRDLRLGHSLQAEASQSLVRGMVQAVAANASASMWLTSLKSADEYTSIHCINVCVLAVAFGRHLGLPRESLEVIGLGALLHDIGKMRTPPEILNKPGRLTPAEFEIMKRHAADGFEMARASGRIPAEALGIIRNHHERVGGHGYPDGLEDEAVTLPMLVVAMADVYDAMTSDRVYRRGMPADRALQVMYRAASREFGQELAEEFIHFLGIYPVGSLVELDSGALGVVIASHRDARLLPVVLLVRSPGGEPYEKRVILNLSRQLDVAGEPLNRVRRVIDPGATGIDVVAIVKAETERE